MGYWEHRKPVRRTRAVDVDDIAETAAGLLDAGGLRALTIRAVASGLDVAPASLYSRVESVDDLFDLALDCALGSDALIQRSLAEADIHDLMVAFYGHLVAHQWACQVIGMRAPRGPNYLRLSERLCTLLVDEGAADPLGTAYAVSNFVIGTATTAPASGTERVAPIDPGFAPTYERLHADHNAGAETLLRAGITALLAQSHGDRDKDPE